MTVVVYDQSDIDNIQRNLDMLSTSDPYVVGDWGCMFQEVFDSTIMYQTLMKHIVNNSKKMTKKQIVNICELAVGGL